MTSFMAKLFRIGLIVAIALFVLRLIFPNVFHIRTLLDEEHKRAAEVAAERNAYGQHLKESGQKLAEQAELLKNQEAAAINLAENLWGEMNAGSYSSLLAHATPDFIQRYSAQGYEEKLRKIFTVMGPLLSDEQAEAMPGYANHPAKTKTQISSTNVVTTSYLWAENAACERTMRLILVEGKLVVDSMVTNVLLYPEKENKIPDGLRGLTVY